MRHFVVLTAILFWPFWLHCRMTESPMQFRNISVEDGLPHNSVSALYKDSEGFLWIGTKEGLVRSDGSKLTKFSCTSGSEIWDINSLEGDTLILATISGLRWFDKSTQTCGTISESPKIWFSTLCKNRDGSVLAGSVKGLYAVKSGSVKRIPISNMLAGTNHITGIIRDPGGNGHWFSTADGLGYLDPSMKPTIYRMQSDGLRANHFTCLKDARGYIYLGSYNRGVYRFDPSTREYTSIDTDHTNLIMHLDSDADNLYVGTNGRGLIVIDLNTGNGSFAVHRRSNRYSIVSNVITSLCTDTNGVYVGTQFGGVSYCPRRGSHFSFYKTPQFNSTEHNARSIFFYPDGEMLLGTRAGIFQIKDGQLVHSMETSDFDGQMRSGIITYIGEAYGKVLVCSYGGGVKVYDRISGRLTPFNENEEYAQNGRIFHFVTHHDGHLWFASHEGVYETDANGNLLRTFSSANSPMKNDATFRLAFDREDRLWIASIFGLALLDPVTGKMTNSHPDLPKDMDVRYVYRDTNDDMWVCGNKGLFCLNGRLELVRKPGGVLPESTVMSVIEYPKDVLWISTLHNIVRYNISKGTYDVFRSSDGIGREDFNGNVGIGPDSNIYWTNEGGLLYTSAVSRKDPPQPCPKVTSVHTGDSTQLSDLNPGDCVTLREGESVQFCFSHLDFRFPEHESFEYMLEGKDKVWKLLSGESDVIYHSLDPGDYTLKLRNPGSGEVSETKVTVRHSLWKLVLFWAGIILLCCLAAVTVYWINRLYRRIAERTQVFSILRKKATKSERNAGSKDESDKSAVNPLMERLLKLVEDQKIYLDPKIKIGTVAGMLGCKETELSRFLNSELSTNFTTFINSYRVKAIKKAMEAGDLKRYTVTAIGLQNGYSSKMTFFRAFKAIEGKTPLEFCKEMGYTPTPEE